MYSVLYIIEYCQHCCLLTANNNVICTNNNDDGDGKSHVTPVKVFPPPASPLRHRQGQQQQQQASDAAMTSSGSRCEQQLAAAPPAAGAGLLELKPFSDAQPPIYYNQAHCIPLYGQYPGQYHLTAVSFSTTCIWANRTFLRGVVRVMWPLLEFYTSRNIFGTDKALQILCIRWPSKVLDTWWHSLSNGSGQGHVTS